MYYMMCCRFGFKRKSKHCQEKDEQKQNFDTYEKVNPLCANFSKWNINIYNTFYVIPPEWYDKGSWNPSSIKTRAYLFYIVNIIMAADVLSIQGARASAAMILT